MRGSPESADYRQHPISPVNAWL